MPTDSAELKQHLLQTDSEFRDLAAVHRQLDERLHELESKHYLSEPEQLEETTIKKRKLHVKDRMEDIMRRYRHATAQSAPSQG
jgi:uncharacterized protein YdcH (DUF465 family)